MQAKQTVHTTGFTHDFGVAGTYTIRIVGNLDQVLYNNLNSNDRQKILSIDQWGTASVWTTMSFAFFGCNQLTILATDAPDLSVCTDMSHMFRAANSFNQSIDHWDVSNITNMSNLFRDIVNFNQPLASWDVSGVTNMRHLFYGGNNFNQPLNSWDVSSVTDMSLMFWLAFNFNQPLNSWDVSNVTNMSGLFAGASNFNQPLDNWNVSNVTNMASMFNGADSFVQPIDAWDVSSVTTMANMFGGHNNYNLPLNSWDVSNVVNMSNMFNNADNFNQPLDNWDVSSVTNMFQMFIGNNAFNQPLDSWDVSNVSDFGSMFSSATAFNQSLGAFDISSATNMNYMVAGSGIDCINYDASLIGWEAQGVSGITLNSSVGFGLTYDIASAAHTSLTTTYGWTIVGDTYAPGCNTDADFIATFKTDNAGNSSNTSVTFPITSASGYQVDFNNDGDLLDAGEATVHTVGFTHDFGVAGTYTVRFVGNLDRILYNNSNANDRQKNPFS